MCPRVQVCGLCRRGEHAVRITLTGTPEQPCIHPHQPCVSDGGTDVHPHPSMCHTFRHSFAMRFRARDSNPMITFHPSFLALGPYAKVRQRHYRTMLTPGADAAADGRDA